MAKLSSSFGRLPAPVDSSESTDCIGKLLRLVIYTMSNPKHGFMESVGLRLSLWGVNLIKLMSFQNLFFGPFNTVHKNKCSYERFS